MSGDPAGSTTQTAEVNREIRKNLSSSISIVSSCNIKSFDIEERAR